MGMSISSVPGALAGATAAQSSAAEETENAIVAAQTPVEKCPSEIWEKVFSHLKNADTATLLACRETCPQFKYWVDKRTSLWSRMWKAGKLHAAVRDHHVDICQLIVGALHEKNPADKWGFTPLHKAARCGHLEICQIIVSEVTDKNPADKWGLTPLHAAAENGHFSIYLMIMNEVADKNPVDKLGHTPLHAAAYHGHLSICRPIVENVADKNPPNNFGRTPLDFAEMNGHTVIRDLLRDAMNN